MSVGLKNTASVVSAETLGQLSRSKGKTLDAEKARLKQATQEFEAFFNHQVLKTMRQTIPTNEKKGPLADGLGKDTWTDMFDMEVARAMSGTGNRSIAEVLYQSLERQVETEYGQESAPKEMHPLKQPDARLHLKPKAIDLPKPAGPGPLEAKPKVELKPAPKSTATPTASIRARYGDIIEQAAEETKLDSTVIASVIAVESSGNPKAQSEAGAKGLMQLMDSTASDYGVTDAFDPKQNILAGSRFLKRMLDRYGELETALAAYNAGPGNVDKYGGIPPFSETRKYVEKVTAHIAGESRD